MSDLTDLLIKLIPIFPLLAVISNGLLGSRYSHDVAHRLAWGSVGLSFLCTVGAFTDVLRTGASREVIAYRWIFGGDLTINLAYLVDPLTCTMLLVVTGVGFLIHVYSVGYMHGETGFTRFFTYMNLFMVSMLLLVMGNNYAVLFIGWEGVGLCSYLLIGYYFEKVSAAKAASKAFVMNRIGDAGFLLAIFLVFILANLLMIPLGIAAIKGAKQMLRAPRAVLLPVILLFCVVGSFAINNSAFGVLLMLAFGLAAYVMEENGFPVAPAILGMVLGAMLEENFISSMIKAEGNFIAFFERPIAGGLGALTLVVLSVPLWRRFFRAAA